MVLLAFAAVYLIWGSTFLAIRLAIASIPPLLMMGVRCTTAGALLVSAAGLRGDRITWRAAGDAFVAGGLMFGITYGALGWAEQRLASGVTALLVATLPFWLVLMDWAQQGTPPSRRTIAGLILGLVGVGLLLAGGLTGSLALAPMAVVLGGEVAWAAGTLYAKPRLPRSVALSAGMPLAAGGLLLLAAAYLAGETRRFDVRTVSRASIAALAYLIVFGSIVAYSAYAWLMRVASPARVGTHAYVNPLVALALGAAAAGEPITSSIASAAVVIAAGVAVVLTARDEPSQRPICRRPYERAYARPATARHHGGYGGHGALDSGVFTDALGESRQ